MTSDICVSMILTYPYLNFFLQRLVCCHVAAAATAAAAVSVAVAAVEAVEAAAAVEAVEAVAVADLVATCRKKN